MEGFPLSVDDGLAIDQDEANGHCAQESRNNHRGHQPVTPLDERFDCNRDLNQDEQSEHPD